MSISMENSQPYRKMGATCRTRPPLPKRIRWTKPANAADNSTYRIGILRRELAMSAAELWRKAYPEVYGSPHEFLLDPERYEPLLAFEDDWEQDSSNKVYCMSVVEEIATARVVAATLLTKFEANLQIEFSFAATHPEYRRRDLTNELRRFTRAIAFNSGAEYFTTFCETWHDITQNWCMKRGWKIAGIFPGNFVRWNGENEEYRGCTVHFYRFSSSGELHATKPEEWALAPEIREVWEALERVNGRVEAEFTRPKEDL